MAVMIFGYNFNIMGIFLIYFVTLTIYPVTIFYRLRDSSLSHSIKELPFPTRQLFSKFIRAQCSFFLHPDLHLSLSPVIPTGIWDGLQMARLVHRPLSAVKRIVDADAAVIDSAS